MTIDNSLESLLATLITSIQSASEALPAEDIVSLKEGISLFDVKNELLLSYLQNLVFLILLKLRSRKGDKKELDLHPQDEVVQRLVEVRIYLDKGVRPLEARLKYQIDKILRSADDVTRRTTQGAAKSTSKTRKHATNNTDSDSDISDAESAGTAQTEDDEDEMTYGPRRAQVTRQKSQAAEERAREASSKKDGIYRPPKITPMAMPTPEGKEARRERRPGKSATLDEFIATELSTAPIAEPSIGSTIVNGGRHTKSEKERREENERREYEEANLTRLAPLSKKELAKQKARQQRNGGFGGEEWRSLGQGLDRIERLTEKKGGKLGTLEKSRKRPVGDGPRGTGAGEAFEKRRKVVGRYK